MCAVYFVESPQLKPDFVWPSAAEIVELQEKFGVSGEINDEGLQNERERPGIDPAGGERSGIVAVRGGPQRNCRPSGSREHYDHFGGSFLVANVEGRRQEVRERMFALFKHARWNHQTSPVG